MAGILFAAGGNNNHYGVLCLLYGVIPGEIQQICCKFETGSPSIASRCQSLKNTRTWTWAWNRKKGVKGPLTQTRKECV